MTTVSASQADKNKHESSADDQQPVLPGQPLTPGQQMTLPGQPMTQPGQPVMQPGQPMMQPGQPMMQPGQPMMQPGQPMMQPGQPMMQPGQPMMQPGQPMINQSGQPIMMQPMVMQNAYGQSMLLPGVMPMVIDPKNPYQNANPVNMKCTSCQEEITTEIEYVVGSCTWLWCIVIGSMGGILCCFLPFLWNGSKDVVHKCPKCKTEVGRFQRQHNSNVRAGAGGYHGRRRRRRRR